MSHSYPPIGDYAVLGECRTAALVSRAGSIDWLCFPRFDGASIFGALLDRRKGGCFAVCPAGEFESTRSYVEDTNVLETVFETPTGRLCLTDFMPVASEAEKTRYLWPERQVLRRVECLEGEVEVAVRCDPRPDYGRVTPRLHRRGRLGLWYEHGGEAVLLRSEIGLEIEEGPDGGPRATGREVLGRGDVRWLSVVHTDNEPTVIPTFGADAEGKLETTLGWWRSWSEGIDYRGSYRAEVVRSALALKLLTFAPSGAVVAAPTTSLPEDVGGVRNWDYRYCWLRDASIILQAFLDLGQKDEAVGFLSWMLHSTRMSRPRLQVLYDVHGETRVAERELDHLEGYRGSRPVRIGNGAKDQLQLDCYGEVVDAAAQYVRRGGRLDRSTGKLLTDFGETVCECWRDPDEGIWEVRSGRQHHTYSKAMCWVALDRLIELSAAGHVEGVPVARFRRECEAIRAEIEERGFDAELGSYVSVFGGEDLDASLLLLARHGYVEGDSERMRGTCRAVRERLGAGCLTYRYRGVDDGLEGEEGAFGIASFWMVDCLCRLGEPERAREMFDELCSLSNDVGLYAEEIDPETGACLGNFPQGFTHAGLIDAAMTLEGLRRTGAGAGDEGEAA